MHISALRQRLQRLPLHKVATILEDSRTQVFCENTAVAFIQLYLKEAGDGSAGRAELMKLVRWPQVTATYLTHCDVDHFVVRALSCQNAVSSAPAASMEAHCAIIMADLARRARPASFLSSMSINWKVSIAELCHSFAKRADRGPVCSASFYFGGLDWHLGYD